MKAVIGTLILVTVTLLLACSGERTPVPTAAAPTDTPVPLTVVKTIPPSPVPESRTLSTPTPTPAPTSEPTRIPSPVFSLDVTWDTTWGQVINAFTPEERNCIRGVIDRQSLVALSRLTLVWSDDDLADEWTPAIFTCVTPDTARALYASLLLAFLEPGLAEGGITITADHKRCAQEKIADVDVAAVLFSENDEAGMEVWGRIITCFPEYWVGSLVGMPEIGVFLNEDELACVREWSEAVDWDTLWEPEDGPGLLAVLTGLADCSPDLVINMVLQESETWTTFWDLTDEELDCLREGMAAFDWASIPAGDEEGMAALADGVNLSQCVIHREPPLEPPEVPPEFSADDYESLLWHFYTEAPVASRPNVVEGVVYFGSEDHYIYALDAANGELLWEFETGDAVLVTPTVSDEAVYSGSEDGYVYALDRETGELLWEHHTRDWVEYSPAFSDGVVYMLSGRYESREIQARDGISGRVLWAVEMPESKRPPAVIGGRIYAIGGYSGQIHSFGAETGELLWALEIEDVDAPPAVTGGVCYVTAYDGAYAVDEATGEILWSYVTGTPVGPPAVVEDGVVYLAEDRHLYALDAATGGVLWSYLSDGPITRSPVVSADMVFLGSVSEGDIGQLRALDAKSGEVVWSQGTEGGYVWSLADADGVLYVEYSDGLLRAIDPATHEQVWEFRTGHQFDGSSHAVADRVLYVGSSAAYASGVYAFTAPVLGD
ncbi:MAG: PQQ-binding-like beta-propeller repeat protein [Chloroflexota bacterium]|nr:PQQ-binding-like beta-propeller repeat protein [Chloroflexota bacterium]